jgi:hypothetical protein
LLPPLAVPAVFVAAPSAPVSSNPVSDTP